MLNRNSPSDQPLQAGQLIFQRLRLSLLGVVFTLPFGVPLSH